MKIISLIIYSFLLLLTSCQNGPQPIHFGKDSCAFCKMTIMDPKFGAEMITTKGKVYKFDDLNCMVQYMTESKINPSEVKAYYVLNWKQPGTLIDALTAEYIFSEELKTPMASHIAATSDAATVDSLLIQWKGQKMNWNDIINHITDH